ncbi:MAG TPA: c-type cytochrome domain-containing protein [Saprospiraceae bacterium]|nr:c-type cytochrome domain-containing protein [Saprospiraceae bacterium]
MIRIHQWLVLGAILAGTVAVSCKHDPYVNPTNPEMTGFCNPDSVYFQNQILPILVSNCTESGCHNAQDQEDGVVLDSYQGLVSTVENATQNDLHENKLMRAILDGDSDDRMPPAPKSPLSTDQINLLKKWLEQGAINNACDENFGGCDPTDARYSTFVQPLVQAKCQGCHSGNNPQGGIKLSNYAEVKAVALNGKLYSSVVRSTNWMPLGGARLDDCNLQRIQTWIQAGAPEN